MPPVVFDKMARKKIAGMVFGKGDNRAVSPVIGVILMVAITVILAAVIGTMVLGMTDSVGQNVQAGANVQYDNSSNAITVTYATSQNADKIVVTVTNSSGGEITADGGFNNMTNVGESLKFTASETDAPFHVVVTATNEDSETVIVEKTID